jgi:hypothetical protein
VTADMKLPTINEVVDGSLDGLSGVELVQLAFLAFIHMDKEDVIPKNELYSQIMTWFDAMTCESK